MTTFTNLAREDDLFFPLYRMTLIFRRMFLGMAISFFPPKTRQANLLHTIKLLAQFFCNVNQDPFKEMDQKRYLLLEILATNGIL